TGGDTSSSSGNDSGIGRSDGGSDQKIEATGNAGCSTTGDRRPAVPLALLAFGLAAAGRLRGRSGRGE
ncbi:MAG: hypothetical protein ABEN55_03385, partial [Bradymonadaceae bacterium]